MVNWTKIWRSQLLSPLGVENNTKRRKKILLKENIQINIETHKWKERFIKSRKILQKGKETWEKQLKQSNLFIYWSSFSRCLFTVLVYIGDNFRWSFLTTPKPPYLAMPPTYVGGLSMLVTSSIMRYLCELFGYTAFLFSTTTWWRRWNN